MLTRMDPQGQGQDQGVNFEILSTPTKALIFDNESIIHKHSLESRVG